MASATDKGGPHWLARYEVKIDPALYPRLYGRLCDKGEFADAFASNLERLAGEYIEMLEAHFAQEESASGQSCAGKSSAGQSSES